MTDGRSFSGTEARCLLRMARTGALATLSREGGTPYASLVNLATDLGGLPIIFISRLAWHTRNLEADPRASILVSAPPASGDALTGARLTVLGRFARETGAGLRERYLAAHPEAAGYADFPDFAYWRLVPETVHAVAGFGRIETLPPAEVFPDWSGLGALMDSAIAHMRDDHPGVAALLAVRLLGAPEAEWKIAAIDPDGLDLSDGSRSLRLAFDAPAHDAGTLRKTLADLANRARVM